MAAVRSAAAVWARENWPELLAGAAGLGVALFFLLSIPDPSGAPGPNAAARPFRALRFQYEFLLRQVPLLLRAWPIAAGVLVAVLGVAIGWRDRLRALRTVWLLGAAATAVEAQIAVAANRTRLALGLYLAAFLLVLIWAIVYRRREESPDAAAPPWPAEWLWLAGVIAIALFFRLYWLGTYPFGYEGDELKFTHYNALVAVDGKSISSQTDLNLAVLPLSTYMQLPFHRILGPSLFAARAAQAFWNLLGVAAFFWLMRQLFRPGVALLATFFLAVSVPDAVSARQGALENFVAAWSSLCLAFLALAVRRRRPGFFALSALTASLGVLTLDTFLPLAGALAILCGWEISRMRGEPLVRRAWCVAAFLTPFALIAIAVVTNFTARFGYYGLSNQGWSKETLPTLARNAADAASLVFKQLPFRDFSYNREGPIENSLILPFLVIGLAYGIGSFTRSRAGWGALWFVFGFVPIPVLIHYAHTRVVYPNLPAIYFLAGIGGWLLYREVAAAGAVSRVAALSALGVWIVLYGALNGYLAFNKILEFPDRVARRELYDAVARNAGPRTIVYLPVMPQLKDTIEIEQPDAIAFGAREASWRFRDSGELAAYEILPFDRLLVELAKPDPARDEAIVVHDKNTEQRRADREKVITTLLRCFPGAAKRSSGDAIDVYALDRDALRDSVCSVSAPQLARIEPVTDGKAPLHWRVDGTPPSRLHVACEQNRPDAFYVEAEAFRGAGWESTQGHAPGASEHRYLVDQWGSQGQPLDLALPAVEGSPVWVWIRTFKRVKDISPGFLSIAGSSHPFFDYGEEKFHRWIWQRLGPYPVNAAGPSTWRLQRPYHDDPQHFNAIYIDSLAVTSDARFDPETDSVWRPRPVEVFELPSPPPSEGTLLVSIPAPGRYRCRLGALADGAIVDPWGDPDPWSEPLEWETD